MSLLACFGHCLKRPAAALPAASSSTQQQRDADILSHKDLVGLLWNGSNDQKAAAAQKVTRDAGNADPVASAEYRRALLLLDVVQPLQAMLRHNAARLRAAAAQAICNLALEAAMGTNDALAACPPPPAPSPPWHLLYEALPDLVPGLRRLICTSHGAPPPDSGAALPAAQALSNLMRGAGFVSRALPLLGPLPVMIKQLAPSPGAELKQQVSQLLLNVALHGGTAAALDAAEAPQALLLLLHQDAPASAHERCLCTLYNMLRGEEGSARRAADIMSLPLAKQAVCSQLYRDHPNCRFLSACLLMCMLRCAAENASEAEWGPSVSDRYVDPSGSGRTPRRRKVRRPEAYRRLAAELGGPGSVILTAVQHALDSALNNGRVRREFAYGRREQLLQALVAALHALCTMDEPTPPPAAAKLAPASGTTRRQQPTNTSTNSALSRGAANSSSAAASQQQQPAARVPLLDQLGSAAVSALLQLLPAGNAQAGGGSGPDTALLWACLSLLSLMTTSVTARKVLLAVKHPGVLNCLAGLVTSVRAFAGGSTPATEGAAGPTAAPGGTPALASATATPRARNGGSQRATAASRAAAAMRDVAAAYLGPTPGPAGSMAGNGRGRMTPGGAMEDAEGAWDTGLAWGRCQALAAKILRNLAVAEPAAVLQHKGVVCSLLLALYGPSRVAVLVANHSGQQQQPVQQPQQQPQQQQEQSSAGAGLAPPVPSLTPRPRPSVSPRPSEQAPAGGVGPEWSQEVQRHAAAALVHLLVTAKGFAEEACAAVLGAGGIPVIAEVMKAAATAATTPELASTVTHQQQQLAAWCAALLGRLYVSGPRCQQALAEALLAPSARRADILALLHLSQPDMRGGVSAVGLGAQYGPMYKSLHRRIGAAAGAGGAATPTSMAASLTTLRSAQPSETGMSSGPETPGAAHEDSEFAALAAGLDEAGAVVRLTPVLEGERAKPYLGAGGGALAGALGKEGDLLASTAASRPAALHLQGDDDSADVLRTSTQAFKDLLSGSPGLGPDAAVRRSQHQQRTQNQSEELRSSVGVQNLAALIRSTSGAKNVSGGFAAAATAAGARGQASAAQGVVGPAVQRAEGSSSSGGYSSSTAAGLEVSTARDDVGWSAAERAAASEAAMRQLEQWLRHCQPSFLDDTATQDADGAGWGPACDEDGTGASLPALEYA